MIQPLSPTIRRTYLIVSVLLFIIVLPLVILYADGWRYQRESGFVKTGGIFVYVPYTDANVYIDDEHLGESGFLTRSFYVDNLTPSAYAVRVEREGDRSWSRQVIVEQQLVTDVRALLMPQEFSIITLATTSATSTPEETQRTISQDDYDGIAAVFATTSMASSTLPVDEQDGIALYIENGDIFARWTRPGGLSPSVFCGRPSFCVDEIAIKRGGSGANYAVFYGGGVIYRTVDGTVTFAEVDIRPTPISFVIHKARGLEARVIGDSIYLKDGRTFLEVEF